MGVLLVVWCAHWHDLEACWCPQHLSACLLGVSSGLGTRWGTQQLSCLGLQVCPPCFVAPEACGERGFESVHGLCLQITEASSFSRVWPACWCASILLQAIRRPLLPVAQTPPLHLPPNLPPPPAPLRPARPRTHPTPQTVTSEDAPPPAPFTAQQLRPHVLTGLAAVISAFRSGACTGGGVSSAASVTSGSGTHINDEDREGSGSGNGDGNRGGEDGSGGTAAAAAASLSGQRVVEQAPQHQLKLTMLMTWDAPGRFDLWCHGEALPNRPRPPVKLEVK